jgi:hypothetical protein
MPRPLVLQFAGKELPLQLEKVARDDLYGYVEIETVDDKGRPCKTAKLASDGRSIIQSGGTAFASLSPVGEWLDRKSLTPCDQDNKPITPVPSAFAAPVPLEETATVDEFLAHNIGSAYQISSDADLGDLHEQLKAGKIFRFPFSFRGGIEADVGFLLLAADGSPFLLIGEPANFEFVGFDQPAGIEEESEVGGDEEDDSLDFGMM